MHVYEQKSLITLIYQAVMMIECHIDASTTFRFSFFNNNKYYAAYLRVAYIQVLSE